MKQALVIGGSNGIGLAISQSLLDRGYGVTVVDRALPDAHIRERVDYVQFDLTSDDYTLFDRFADSVDVVMITAGIGQLALFEHIDETQIDRYFHINTIPAMRLAKRFYHRLLSPADFYFGIMVSIAGFMSSPFFSVYGATKAALKIFIESVNVELQKAGSANRILNVSPGSIQGTHFNGGQANDMDKTQPLADEIVDHLLNKDDLFIPQYDEVFSHVLERYHRDFRAEGIHSYDYKLASGRVK